MAASDIVVTPVDGKADLKAFIQLPVRLLRRPQGLHPAPEHRAGGGLLPEEESAVQARRGPVLPRPPRRPGGGPHHRPARSRLSRALPDNTGHFGCLVAEDDPAIFAALFAAAEDWLRAKGMKRGTGPFSLSVNEEVGLLVDGFDSPLDADGALRSALFGRRGSRPTATPRSRTSSPTTTTSRTRPRRSARS